MTVVGKTRAGKKARTCGGETGGAPHGPRASKNGKLAAPVANEEAIEGCASAKRSFRKETSATDCGGDGGGQPVSTQCPLCRGCETGKLGCNELGMCTTYSGILAFGEESLNPDPTPTAWGPGHKGGNSAKDIENK